MEGIGVELARDTWCRGCLQEVYCPRLNQHLWMVSVDGQSRSYAPQELQRQFRDCPEGGQALARADLTLLPAFDETLSSSSPDLVRSTCLRLAAVGDSVWLGGGTSTGATTLDVSSSNPDSSSSMSRNPLVIPFPDAGKIGIRLFMFSL